MADDKNWNFGRMDRVAIIALLVGLAGVIGPMFLPPDFIDYVPHGWRLGISLGSGIVIACGVLYLLWDFGQVFRIVRIVFYILVFVIVMGASIALFGGLALWLRGLLGATAGATLVIGLPYLYPDLRQVIQGSSVAESSAAVARLAELGWGVQPDDAGILFSIASKPLPPMKESADLFRHISGPFHLHFQGVGNIEGLHYLSAVKNLTDIGISAGEMTDISELRGLTQLKVLRISQTPLNGPGIIDVSSLAELTNLQILVLYSVRTRTIESLIKLTKLRQLSIQGTLVSDLSPVADFGQLEKLDIRDSHVSNLTALSQNKELVELEVGHEQLAGLSSLSNLHNLKTLRIIDNDISDLSSIEDLTSLEDLWIWGAATPVTLDIKPIRRLTKLRRLSIAGMGLGVTPALGNPQIISGLTKLNALTLGYMRINNFDFVVPLKNLEELNINQIPISSIEPLRNLRALRKVVLNTTSVVDVSPLLDLPDLTDLAVGRTPARSDILTELERRGVKVTRY